MCATCSSRSWTRRKAQAPLLPRRCGRKYRWLTRGWCLRELLAPANVCFYNRRWEFVGSKIRLGGVLSRRRSRASTSRSCATANQRSAPETPLARKMFWAAGRTTSRVEDAYGLLSPRHFPHLHAAALRRRKGHLSTSYHEAIGRRVALRPQGGLTYLRVLHPMSTSRRSRFGDLLASSPGDVPLLRKADQAARACYLDHGEDGR